MANFLHGVEVVEVNEGARPINVVRSAVIGLIGVAPKGDKNEAVLVNSAKDAAQFGKQVPGYNIPQALDAIIKQGAGTVIVVNALDESTNLTSVTDESVTVEDFSFKTANAPYENGNVVVETDPSGTTYDEGVDYEFDAFGNFTVLKDGGISEGDSLLVDYDYFDESTVDASQLIGEVDGTTGARSGLEVFDEVFNLYGFNPRLLIAPQYSSLDSLRDELIAKAEKFRGRALIDAPKGTTVSDAIAGRGPSGTINFDTSSERVELCYPHVKAYDPATDSYEDRPYSQFLAGIIAATINEDGYWFSASNREILGINGLERRLSASVNDPQTDVNLLNEKGITTIFNSYGSGLRTWGNRNASFPSNSGATTFNSVRLTADVIHDSVEQAMLQFIDRPINNALIEAIKESVNAFLRTLISRGAIIDGNCSFDKDKNPDTEIANGHLTFDIEFMPPTPAERVTFDSYININLLSQLGA